MKKIHFKIIIILSYLFLLNISTKKQTNIHVYIDPATTPALLQITDFIKQPEDDFKIISWNRYQVKNQETYSNTLFLKLENNQRFSPHDDFKHIKDNDLLFFIQDKIRTAQKTNSKVNLHVHFNIQHPYYYFLLKNHPDTKDKIASIHAYEDSSGRFYWDNSQSKNDILLNAPIKPHLYYWEGIDQLCHNNSTQQKCIEFKNTLKKVIPVSVNFEQLSSKLSEQEKNMIFKITGFDYEKTKNMFSGKNSHVYILGYDYRNPIIGTQLSNLRQLCQTEEKTENDIWFYKNHPNGMYWPSHEALNHLCPGILPLDSKIPFELLALSGFHPQKVAGYSSSIFLNINNKSILSYLARKNDPYLEILQQTNKQTNKPFDNERIITQEQQETLLEKNGIYLFLDKSHDDDIQNWYLKINPNTFLNIFTAEKISILKETKNEFTIQYPKDKTTIFKRQEGYRFSNK